MNLLTVDVSLGALERPKERRKRNQSKLQLPGRKICLKMIFFLLSQQPRKL
jgi:hypothetical protein